MKKLRANRLSHLGWNPEIFPTENQIRHRKEFEVNTDTILFTILQNYMEQGKK